MKLKQFPKKKSLRECKDISRENCSNALPKEFPREFPKKYSNATEVNFRRNLRWSNKFPSLFNEKFPNKSPKPIAFSETDVIFSKDNP